MILLASLLPHCTLDCYAFFNTGNVVTKAFEFNQIREPIPEAPKPFEKTHL